MARPTALIADDEPLLREALAGQLAAAWPELEDDRRVRDALHDALEEAGLPMHQVNVTVNGGRVRLWGWIDSETQALLNSLVESLPTARLLLLVTYRPEYQHGWSSKTYYTQLRLDPRPGPRRSLLFTLPAERSSPKAV